MRVSDECGSAYSRIIVAHIHLHCLTAAILDGQIVLCQYWSKTVRHPCHGVNSYSIAEKRIFSSIKKKFVCV